MSLTETKIQIQLILLGSFLIALAIVVVPWRASASTLVTLYQQLKPDPCTPVLTYDTNGAASLSLTPNCGELVLPGPSGVSRPSGSAGGYVPANLYQQSPIDVFFGNAPVYLETDPAQQSKRGYMLLTELHARYAFYLTGDNRDAPARTMEIIGVGTDTVLVQFWPGGARYPLQVGQRVNIDLNTDGSTDIQLKLQQIGSDGAVLLHVSFPPQPASALTSVQEDRFAFLASVTAFTGLALIIINYMHNIYLKKHSLPAQEWWSLHSHDPLDKGGAGHSSLRTSH